MEKLAKILLIPYIEYISYFVKTPIGFTLLIITPVTILINMEIRKNSQISEAKIG